MTDFALWGIILIPVLVPLFLKFALKWDISWLEWGVQVLVIALAATAIWAVGRYSAANDTEIVNGSVTAKHPWRFSCPEDTSNPCRNSYQCHPYEVCSTSTDSKGRSSQSCTTHYHTCYDYDWEQNWYVDNNMPVNSSIEIARVDRQGADEPQRYSQAQIGDPTSAPHGYKNWVKASVGSLYHEDAGLDEKYAPLISPYPSRFYDYYNIDRIITPNNFPLANKAAWNHELAKATSTLGPTHQMNLVVVMINNAPREYAYGLRREWKGFKKNDAVIVIGLKNGNIEWAEVMSWSKNAMFNIELRNAISVDMQGAAINSVDPAVFFAKVQDISSRDFVRRPMKEFEYLKGSIPPPTWLLITTTILAFLVSIGTSFWFKNFDLDAAIFNRRRSYY